MCTTVHFISEKHKDSVFLLHLFLLTVSYNAKKDKLLSIILTRNVLRNVPSNVTELAYSVTFGYTNKF